MSDEREADGSTVAAVTITGNPADVTPPPSLVGEWVEVAVDGRIVDRGRVEAAMKDSSILWLAADGVTPRRIVEIVPGLEIHQRTPL